MFQGLRGSVNTIAVQTLQAVGVTDAYNFATENLGLSLVPEDWPSAPGHGRPDLRPEHRGDGGGLLVLCQQRRVQRARTYVKVLANDNTTVVLENEAEQHVAMKETTAYLMTDMLQEAVYGTGGAARFSGMHIAGKTGTTNDSYDRYFVGYTPYYCAAVWVGYKNNEKIATP